MQSLNINDAGFSYIFNCMALYSEGGVYFVIYVISLLFVCTIAGRYPALQNKDGTDTRKRDRLIFLPQAVMMLLTVFNPVFPVLLNSIFDVNKEYYRFLWMLPVITLIAYAGVKIVFETSKNTARGLIAAVLLICIFMSAGTCIYENGYAKAENIYKMPAELLQVAQIIHRDSDVEYPRAMFEYDYNMQIRQYDASILLPCTREQYLNAVSGGIDHEKIHAEENYYNRLLAVVALNIRLDKEDFLKGLEETDTEYVVLSSANDMLSHIKSMGLKEVGRTANHIVLHYGLETRKEFSLADYSEVWAMGY